MPISRLTIYLPLAAAASALDGLSYGLPMIESTGGRPIDALAKEKNAASETLRAAITLSQPAADLSKVQWSDYPGTYLEDFKKVFSEELFYDLFREIVAFLSRPDELFTAMATWSELKLNHARLEKGKVLKVARI